MATTSATAKEAATKTPYKLYGEVIEAARNKDIVYLMTSAGYRKGKEYGNKVWFYSPFRDETRPSFMVLTDLNRYVDFGDDGHRHSSIDFSMKLYNMDFNSAVSYLTNGAGALIPLREPKAVKPETVKYENVRALPVRARNHIGYMESRGIPSETLKTTPQLCTLRYDRVTPDGKRQHLYNIGFRNDAGGYAVRVPTDSAKVTTKKLNIGHTDITTIRHGSSHCYIFEGFMDYLSFAVMNPPKASATDTIILNSVNNSGRAVDAVQANAYTSVHLLLDKDRAGNDATTYILGNISTVDAKDLRADCIKHGKDVNDELIWRLHHQQANATASTSTAPTYAAPSPSAPSPSPSYAAPSPTAPIQTPTADTPPTQTAVTPNTAAPVPSTPRPASSKQAEPATAPDPLLFEALHRHGFEVAGETHDALVCVSKDTPQEERGEILSEWAEVLGET